MVTKTANSDANESKQSQNSFTAQPTSILEMKGDNNFFLKLSVSISRKNSDRNLHMAEKFLPLTLKKKYNSFLYVRDILYC